MAPPVDRIVDIANHLERCQTPGGSPRPADTKSNCPQAAWHSEALLRARLSPEAARAKGHRVGRSTPVTCGFGGIDDYRWPGAYDDGERKSGKRTSRGAIDAGDLRVRRHRQLPWAGGLQRRPKIQAGGRRLLQSTPVTCGFGDIRGNRGLFSVPRLYREHRDAFELPEEIFRKQYRLPKIVVRWLCDELREEPEVRRVRTSWTVMTVELQVLCALRFYGTGSFQGMVASDEHVARDQKTVSVAVRAVSVAIVRRLGVQRGWIHFPETPSERFDAEKGFRLLGRIPGVIGCVDGTMVSIVGPSKNDPTVTKAAYWCRKYFYALNVMVVCDADCRIMCIDPRYPGSVHDSFVWQFSWLRNQLEQGQLPRDGRFLLGDSGYPLEPWLITPVPGNHATSTACGRFNKAHSSISAPQHLPCIERARTGVRLRP
ncbi:putative nuclease HARBI1 isoform X1 [Ixodes scapularis]